MRKRKRDFTINRFTINLRWLYRNMGTEEDETPEDLMKG